MMTHYYSTRGEAESEMPKAKATLSPKTREWLAVEPFMLLDGHYRFVIAIYSATNRFCGYY